MHLLGYGGEALCTDNTVQLVLSLALNFGILNQTLEQASSESHRGSRGSKV